MIFRASLTSSWSFLERRWPVSRSSATGFTGAIQIPVTCCPLLTWSCGSTFLTSTSRPTVRRTACKKGRTVWSMSPARTAASWRLTIATGGQRLYTENEEDASISVIDVPSRLLIRQVPMPHPLAGLAISPDGKLLVAVDDQEPMLFVIETATLEIVKRLPLADVPEPGQIARYSPDGLLLLVTSMR